jgi:hypothetical protein
MAVAQSDQFLIFPARKRASSKRCTDKQNAIDIFTDRKVKCRDGNNNNDN